MSFVETITTKIQSIRTNIRETIERVRPKVLFTDEIKGKVVRPQLLETLAREGYKPGILIETALTRIKEVKSNLALGSIFGEGPAGRSEAETRSEAEVKSQAGITFVSGKEKPTFIYSHSTVVSEEATKTEKPKEETAPVEETVVSEVKEVEKKKSFFF